MANETIADLLEQSRAAHDEYRANVPRMASAGGAVVAVGGDVVKAAAALERAARLRKQAADQDPGYLDDAWTVDHEQTGGPHALLTWYGEHLARVDDPVALAAQRIADGVLSPALVAAEPAEVDAPAPGGVAAGVKTRGGG